MEVGGDSSRADQQSCDFDDAPTKFHGPIIVAAL
jgi:hypothetical protein